MLCDRCQKDYCFWNELFWNGRYKHADTFFRICKRKMYVCEDCLKIDHKSELAWRAYKKSLKEKEIANENS